MNRLHRLALLLLLIGSSAWSATINRVNGDLIEVRDAPGARVGDAVEILTRLPGFDEAGKVGSGRVTSVSADGWTARIDQRTGSLAVGQEVRLSGAPATQRATPSTPSTRSGEPTGSVADLERKVNEALRQGQFERLNATVAADQSITLRGAVSSVADKERAMQIARSLAKSRAVKDQVFIVEP